MKTMRCLDCYWFKWSFLTGEHNEPLPQEILWTTDEII